MENYNYKSQQAAGSSSDTGSSTSSLDKSSGNKWENYISSNGELFYVDCIVGSKSIKNENKHGGRNMATNSKSPEVIKSIEENDEKKVTKITNFENLAKVYGSLFGEDRKRANDSDNAISLLIICTSNDKQSTEDVIYSYPKKELNEMLLAKGSLLTLNSIITNDFKTELVASNLRLGEKSSYVFYKVIDSFLVIFAGINKHQDNCILKNEYHAVAENLFKLILSQNILQPQQSPTVDTTFLTSVCEILNTKLTNNLGRAKNQIFNLTNFLKVPKDTEAKISDALNEMEAMDYRDWNDEPLTSHREFFICGSMLYYNTYLIANHLPNSHAHRIKLLLHFSGILELVTQNIVNEFICWYELRIPHAQQRYFLAICTRSNLTIASLLQTIQVSAVTDQPKPMINPSLFYIEEIQDTLDYLKEKGVGNAVRSIIDAKLTEKNKAIAANVKSEHHIKKHFIDEIKMASFITSSHSNHSQTHSEDDSNNRDDEYSEMDSEWDGFPNSYKSASEIDKHSECKRSVFKGHDVIVLSDGMGSKKVYITNLIQINFGSGIFISHIEKCDDILMEKFGNACQLIHNILSKSKHLNVSTVAPDGTNVINASYKYLNNVKEHGINLTVDNAAGHQVKYWVIGRKLEIPAGEIYVCHQEDIPQNLIELAFRLMSVDDR